jgi:hypothetical protein
MYFISLTIRHLHGWAQTWFPAALLSPSPNNGSFHCPILNLFHRAIVPAAIDIPQVAQIRPLRGEARPGEEGIAENAMLRLVILPSARIPKGSRCVVNNPAGELLNKHTYPRVPGVIGPICEELPKCVISTNLGGYQTPRGVETPQLGTTH